MMSVAPCSASAASVDARTDSGSAMPESEATGISRRAFTRSAERFERVSTTVGTPRT